MRVTSTSVNDVDLNDVGPYDRTRPSEPYVAAAWDDVTRVPEQITIGSGTTTAAGGETYMNVPLSSNTAYEALVRVEIVSDNPAVVCNHYMSSHNYHS